MIPGTHKLAYRPDIDGLRAIAVLAVVLFHAGLGMPGGYVGVDVFFVISGFLITSLILKDLRKGTFSFLHFWERRARRILPALAVVVAATLVVGWFLLLPNDYASLAKVVIALIAFSSNIQLWRSTGYFDTSAEEKPLLHTWSLSLEEQFYLFIPLLLALLFRFQKSSWIPSVLVLGSLLSFALSIYGSYRAPTATFFLLPTRAWELAAGSLLAFASPVGKTLVRSTMAWGGFGGVLIPILFYTPETRFPGLAALPPVAGAALLIWSGMSNRLERSQPLPHRILASRPLVAIGLLSYSLYLWHWPFFAFHRYFYGEPAPWALSLGYLTVSFLLAALSLRFVERPFRSRSFVGNQSTVFALSAAAVATLLVPSLGIWQSKGVWGRLPAEYATALNAAEFIPEHTAGDVPHDLAKYGALSASPEVVVWGDSHAMAILPGVDAACRELGIGAIAATASATAPATGWFIDSTSGLGEESILFNRRIMNYVRHWAEKDKALYLIMAANWRPHLESTKSNPSFPEAFHKTLKKLQDVGCQTIIMRRVPVFLHGSNESRKPAIYAMNGMAQSCSNEAYEADHGGDALLTRFFDKIATDFPHVTVIDPSITLTDSQGLIILGDDGGPYYRDSHHLSVHGSMRLKGLFQELIR